jgi:copper chaperone
MENITLNVQGMSCGKCVKSVEESVGAVNGVNEVAVDLQAAKVNVTFDEAVTSVEAIKETIEDQGYDVQ